MGSKSAQSCKYFKSSDSSSTVDLCKYILEKAEQRFEGETPIYSTVVAVRRMLYVI